MTMTARTATDESTQAASAPAVDESPRDGIAVSRDAGVLVIKLDRPDRLNAFNATMHAAMREALSTARDDPAVRAVLLTGNGKGFCAGQDLGDRDPSKLSGPPDLERSAKENYNRLILLVREIPKPVICAVNGVAAGAGASLALACDIVLASESARFILSFVKVGLALDAGASWTLPRLIGQARAKAISMTAAPVSAAQAESWGMIWRAVPDKSLLSEALALARSLAEGPTFALGSIKQAFEASTTNNLPAQLGVEARMQGQAGRSSDYSEGVTAFLNRRKPSFTGTPPE